MKTSLKFIVLLLTVFSQTSTQAWDPGEVDTLDKEAQTAKAGMLKSDPDMKRFFNAAAGYVIIPSVGKGGVGIGGAYGKGLLYENGAPSAVVKMTQFSFGFQFGGQVYSEFIFFKDDVALSDFKRGNFELNAQASAVAVTAGASADADYSSGVAIFTQAKGGLMYEAAVGGQKFSVDPR